MAAGKGFIDDFLHSGHLKNDKMYFSFKKFKFCSSSAPKSKHVYTLPTCSLPSHYKSLLPSRDCEVQQLLQLEATGRRIRTAVSALAALLVVLVVGVLSVIVVTHLSFEDEERLVALHHITSEKDVLVSDIHSLQPTKFEDSTRQTLYLSKTREIIPCQNMCWQFAAFKFGATCESQRCRCRNHRYQDDNCLPQYGKCKIRLQDPESTLEMMDNINVMHRNKKQPIYICKTNSRGSTRPSYTPKHRNIERSNNPSLKSTDAKTLRTQGFKTARRLRLKKPSKVFKDEISEPSRNHTNIERYNTRSLQIFSATKTTASNSRNQNLELEPTVLRPHKTDSFSGIKGDKIQMSTHQNKNHNHKIIVVSVHGSRPPREELTNVTVSGSDMIETSLVLVTYGRRHWNVNIRGSLVLRKVLLVSNHRISATTISITYTHEHTGASDEQKTSSIFQTTAHNTDQKISPTLTRKLLRTGYGDDRKSGDTPQLLKSITKIVGEIHTFIGCEKADVINIDADAP